jgi:hypothetical protein
MQDLHGYIKEYKTGFIEKLIELPKITSIIADSAFNKDLENTAIATAQSKARRKTTGHND